MLKKIVLTGMFLFIVIGVVSAATTQTILGEVVDLSCYVTEGARGAAHETCAIACIKNGEPAGILEEKTGKIYLVVTGDHSNPADKVLPFVAKMVEVTGMVNERSGIMTVDIQTIKEIPAQPAEPAKAPMKEKSW
jgi:hypothetical protein